MGESTISYSHFNGGPPENGDLPLLLIHGAGGTRHNWPPEIRRMRGIDVYGLDLPGHGDSFGISKSTIEEFARDVLSWMDELNMSRTVVGGHSMGGAITLTLALMAPERTAGIVLVSTGAKLRVHPEILALTSSQDQYHKAAELVTKWSFSENADTRVRELARERLKEVAAKVVHSDFLACDSFDLMQQVKSIKAPALVICGEEDQLTPVKFSRYLSEHIEGADLFLVPGAGHMVMLEEPKIVANAIREFTKEWSAGNLEG